MVWLSESYDIIPFVLAVCSGIVCLLAMRILLKGSSVPRGIRAPPGTLGLPFVGETIGFLRAQKKGAPHEFYDSRVQRYGHNLFTTHLLGHPTVVLCSPEGNHFLFSNENKLVLNSWPSSVAALFKYSLINAVGDDGRRLKRMLMRFLGAEALQKFIGRMDSITIHHLREHWSGKDQVSVYPLMKHYTFSLACDLFASLNGADAKAKLSANFNILLKGLMSIPIDLPGSQYYKAKVAANAIRQQLAEIIEQRRIALRNASAFPEQDLLSLLLCSVDEEGGKALTDDEIKDNILLLLFAGHDTSSCVLTSLFKFLAENPECYEQVLREQLEIAVSKKQGQLLEWEDLQKMKYSWRVAQETLRLQPPVQGTYRQAIKDFTYCGFSIPKGWKLHWTVNSTHHKSQYFSNPKKFDPTRFEGMGPAPYTFVPFGGGQRMCPGNEFARVEILVLLHNIVKNYRWTLVDPEEEVSVDPMPVPRKGLPVKLFPCPH